MKQNLRKKMQEANSEEVAIKLARKAPEMPKAYRILQQIYDH